MKGKVNHYAKQVCHSFVLVHKIPGENAEASILNICDEVDGDPKKIVAFYLSQYKGIEVYGIVEIQPQMREKFASSLRRNGLYVNRKNYIKEHYEHHTKGINDLPDNYFSEIVCAENYILKQ